MNTVSRRGFLASALGAAALPLAAPAAENAPAPAAGPKIKLGLIGCGGRGSWIFGLFGQHGGYHLHACADYFPDRVKACGDKSGVPEERRFTGLDGYKRLLSSGVEAVAIQSPPYFHPEQAAAAVDAGLHVYLAKPIAVDAPGCLSIGDSARRATAKKRVFLVDFQARTDEFLTEAVRRIRQGAIGEMVFSEHFYHADNPFTGHLDAVAKDPGNPEVRLRAWGLDRVLSGDIIVEQNIHTLDIASWVIGKPPRWASGTASLTGRPKIGTCRDHFLCLFDYGGGMGLHFSSRQFNGHDSRPEGIWGRTFGSKGVLEAGYGTRILIRGDSFYEGGKVNDIYPEGARRNIAAFHTQIVEDRFENATAEPSVQSNLLCVLGRMAADRGAQVTWDEMLAKPEKLEADLKGLKA